MHVTWRMVISVQYLIRSLLSIRSSYFRFQFNNIYFYQEFTKQASSQKLPLDIKRISKCVAHHWIKNPDYKDFTNNTFLLMTGQRIKTSLKECNPFPFDIGLHSCRHIVLRDALEMHKIPETNE